MAWSHGVPLQKRYGQHFLRNQQVVDHMLDAVALDNSSSVFEIGCGDGFLTRGILRMPIARLWIYEIDERWVAHIRKTINDQRVMLNHANFLDIDFTTLQPHAPWTILANLPYQVTFPILYKLQANRHLLKEGVVMVQEEVAQKIVKTHGRDYGFVSLFFQHYFEWRLLDKVAPSSFLPPPKVFSRLIYLKPRENIIPIPEEERFWQFVKFCFKQPRRTLRNNLRTTQYADAKIPDSVFELRAQQLSMSDLLTLWKQII